LIIHNNQLICIPPIQFCMILIRRLGALWAP